MAFEGGVVVRARETRQAVQRRGCSRSDFKVERNLCVISVFLKLQKIIQKPNQYVQEVGKNKKKKGLPVSCCL